MTAIAERRLEQLLPFTRPDGATVVPERAIAPDGTSDAERDRQNAADMERSEQIASVVALRALGYDVVATPRGVLVTSVSADVPAAKELKPEDVISIKSSSSAGDTIRKATELVSTVPAWLQADHDSLTAKVLRYPERAEISAPVQEQLIVELYSK